MSVRGPATGTESDTPIARVRCNLVDENLGESLDTFYADFFRPDEASPGYCKGLQIGALATFDETTEVAVNCYTFGPNAGQIASAKLVATQVSHITEQGG